MPVLDASSPARVGPVVTATQTCAAFNPPANSYILIAVTIDTSGITNTTITVTNNGTPLTWTLIGRQSGDEAGSSAGTGTVAWYRAFTPTALSGLTVTAASSITGRNMTTKVYVYTNVDQANPIGAVLEGSQTVNTATLTTGSLVMVGAASTVLVSANESEGLNTTAPTSAANTVSPYVSSGNHCGLSGFRTGGAVGASENFVVVAAQAGRWNWVAFELRDAPVVVAPRPPRKPNRTHPKFRR